MPQRPRLKGSFLVLTEKGMNFVQEWFRSKERVPSSISKLYQLLLKTAMMQGVITIRGAQSAGGSHRIVEKAISDRYLRLTPKPLKPSQEVLQKIQRLIGEPPKQLYT